MSKQYSNFRRLFKVMFNVRKMIDFDRIKYFIQYIGQLAKTYFVPQPIKPQDEASRNRTFDDALKKYALSDTAVQAKQTALLRLSIFMLLVGCGLLVYAVYHLVLGSWRGFFPGLTLFAVSIALAFRYHFWYFQLKHRKLGCTLTEWRKGDIKDDNP